MAQLPAMWQTVVEQIRRAGPRKVAIITVLVVVVVVLAYGNNSSDDASGHTLSHSQAAGLLAAPLARP